MSIARFRFYNIIIRHNDSLIFRDFLVQNNDRIGRYGIYDRYLYASGGAMSYDDIRPSIEYWESLGFYEWDKTRSGRGGAGELYVCADPRDPSRPPWLDFDKQNGVFTHKLDVSKNIVIPMPLDYDIDRNEVSVVQGQIAGFGNIFRGTVRVLGFSYGLNVRPDGFFEVPIHNSFFKDQEIDHEPVSLLVEDFETAKNYEVNIDLVKGTTHLVPFTLDSN